jgi:hypothetical protein
MKRLVYLLSALFSLSVLVGSAHAQHSERGAFDSKVQELLSRRPKLQKIFDRSEVAKHVIEELARRELAVAGREQAKESIAAAFFDTKNISNGVGTMESETSVAISRTNSNLIVAGANDDMMFVVGMPAYVSTNGGKSWREKRLPNPVSDVMLTGGDPVVIPAPGGGFYYSYLSYDFDFMYSDVQIAYSANGLEWELRTPVVQREDPTFIIEDKEWIAADNDPASPYFGRLYVAWRRFDLENDYYPFLFSWSDDGGWSWSEPRELDFDHDYFVQMQTGSGGKLYISASFSQGFSGSHGMLISKDGGASFEEHKVTPFGGLVIQNQSGHTMLKGAGGFRAFPYTTFDVDPSSNNVYLVSGTSSDGEIGDLMYHFSSNGGSTWRKFTFKKAGKFFCDRFMPAVSFDKLTKTAWVTYYSSEQDELNTLTKIFRAELTPTGVGRIDTLQNEEFDPFECISESRPEPSLGDYIDSDADQGKHVAIWAQSPPLGGDVEVYGAVSTIGSSDVQYSPIRRLSFTLSEPLEQPVTSALTLSYSGAPGTATIAIYDTKASLLSNVERKLEGESTISVDVNALAAGFYQAIVTINGESTLRKFVKQ